MTTGIKDYLISLLHDKVERSHDDSSISFWPSPPYSHRGHPRQPHRAQPRTAETVTVQPWVVDPTIVVGAVAGGVMREKPVGHVTGMKGHAYTGHSGLPASTQISGHAWKPYVVVVA
jgi:hypothetical protein